MVLVLPFFSRVYPSRGNPCVFLVFLLLWIPGCGLWNPGDSLDYEPSRVPVGPLGVGVWLPAGLEEFRFGGADQDLLLGLKINQIEWLQRAVRDSATAEEIAMAFCNRAGVRMPVYYEPRGYSPYDKLHNWAARARPGPGFAEAVRQRVRSLRGQWGGAPGFWGYLVGHEDYRREYYPALRQTVEVLRQEDPLRPAITAGRIDSYPAVERFLDAFFIEGGEPNVFQHEHYVFRADVPLSGKRLQRRLDELVEGYDRVARRLQGRHGRWHAIVQAQGEERDGEAFYRKPTPAELRVQVGMALSRGASGIVYFLYSSGVEEVRNAEGRVVQTRVYAGLVDQEGMPASGYFAAQEINGLQQQMSPALEGLRFHGGFSHRRLLENPLLRRADEDLEFGLFGDGVGETHLLVVNRRTTEARSVKLGVGRPRVEDAVTGQVLKIVEGEVEVELEAGGFRLFAIH